MGITFDLDINMHDVLTICTVVKCAKITTMDV